MTCSCTSCVILSINTVAVDVIKLTVEEFNNTPLPTKLYVEFKPKLNLVSQLQSAQLNGDLVALSLAGVLHSHIIPTGTLYNVIEVKTDYGCGTCRVVKAVLTLAQF
jgi:hypothetical protein